MPANAQLSSAQRRLGTDAELRGWLDDDGVRAQYTAGLREDQVALLSPDTWTLDRMLLARPGNREVQLDLFADYRTNVELYPQFQAFFRGRRPPALIVWGRRDVFFTPAGATAYKRDLPDAELHLLDAGHFALETHGPEIASLCEQGVDALRSHAWFRRDSAGRGRAERRRRPAAARQRLERAHG